MKLSLKKELELKRVIRNYNAKIRRMENNIYNSFDVPDYINIKDYRKKVEEMNNIYDFNFELKRLKGFSKRGGEIEVDYRGLKNVPKYEVEHIKRLERRVLYKIDKEIDEYGNSYSKVMGKKQQFTNKENKDMIYINMIRKRERIKNMFKKDILNVRKYKENVKDLNDYKEYVKKQGTGTSKLKMQTAQNNFIKDILYSTGVNEGVPIHIIRKLQSSFSELTPEQFDIMYKYEKFITAIFYNYNAYADVDNSNEKVKLNNENIKDIMIDFAKDINNIIEEYKML